MKEVKHWEYDVKCRKCDKITRMFFSTQEQVTDKDFRSWVNEHSTFPIEKPCKCDSEMMMLHDIISYSLLL